MGWLKEVELLNKSHTVSAEKNTPEFLAKLQATVVNLHTCDIKTFKILFLKPKKEHIWRLPFPSARAILENYCVVNA